MREVAILITAREMDSQFEWVAHEPEALKEGVPQQVIDVIKHRRSTAGIDETDALVIELGRQVWRDHKVNSETFAKAKARFGPNMLIDLVMLMGNYAGTAALLAAGRHAIACRARSRCCRSRDPALADRGSRGAAAAPNFWATRRLPQQSGFEPSQSPPGPLRSCEIHNFG